MKNYGFSFSRCLCSSSIYLPSLWSFAMNWSESNKRGLFYGSISRVANCVIKFSVQNPSFSYYRQLFKALFFTLIWNPLLINKCILLRFWLDIFSRRDQKKSRLLSKNGKVHTASIKILLACLTRSISWLDERHIIITKSIVKP